MPTTGASAATGAHPRHVAVSSPRARGSLFFGEVDGYEIGMSFEEPDLAVLYAETFDPETQIVTVTSYGAHYRGSLPFGRLRADFGAVGSISLRFRPDGKGRSSKLRRRCTGRPAREEDGHFVGRIALRGEGDYFHISRQEAGGYLSRRFRLRCQVIHAPRPYPGPSLREAVMPPIFLTSGGSGGSLVTLGAENREDGRQVELRAARVEGASAADLQAVAFEYQGRMPVGRGAEIPQVPAGTLLTTLPGEHPTTATLKPPAPFSGEAQYVANSPTSHSWTGTLAVQFPGLLQPLAGPNVFSSLCVVSLLRDRSGCDFVPPDWQVAGPAAPPEQVDR